MNKIFKKDIVQIVKYFIFLTLEVIIFFFLTNNLLGVTLSSIQTAFIVIVSLALINALLWPILSYISLGFIVLTLGFGTFLIDGLLLWIMSNFVPGFYIDGVDLFLIPLLIGIISSILSLILNIDEDDTYYRFILKKELEITNKNVSNKEGFIFLEIDGLARDIFEEALENDVMPTLKRWMDDETHKLVTWETDLSSQTGASQAGILHGNNNNIPAFRWVEKENDNKIVSSNGFSDARLIEERISDGNGLLSCNGASRGNLFSGDATDYILTFSKFVSKTSLFTKTWYYLFSNPYFIVRVLVLFLWDIILEFSSRIIHLFKNIKPRLRRGLVYYIARSGANVVVREATTFSLIGDIFAGNYNTMYATYMGYDEIAHHSGIRDFDSMYALKQIDKQFQHLEHAIIKSHRKYNLIVLSDHGQSNGPTFKQKYGLTLNDLVKQYLPENITIHSILHSNDDHLVEYLKLKPQEQKQKLDSKIDNTWDYIIDLKNKASSQPYIKELKDKRELLKPDEPIFDKLNSISKKYGLDIHLPKEKIIKNEVAQTIVLASGNLGLIYFTDWSNRLTFEQIEDAFPNLIQGLASHPGIGFVMVKSSIYGTIILSNDDVYYLEDEKYVGNHFLEAFGENIVKHLKRTDSFEHIPDILVNSKYDEENDEVYAFEELIGSHGGVGGTQQEPFIFYPSNWVLNDKIIGAEKVNEFFKKEILKTWKENK